MTGEPPPPTQTIPPGTPDEKLALLIATLLDIILTILEALPIPGFLRRPLQNRARHECAALLTRLLNTRVPAPAQTKQPVPAPAPTGPKPRTHETPAPDRAQRTTRAPIPAAEPAITEPFKPRDRRHSTPDRPSRARRVAMPARIPASGARLPASGPYPPTPNFQKPAQAARLSHAHLVTIS